MRDLQTTDLFALSRILKKMDIKKEIKTVAKDVTGLNDEEKIKAAQSLQIDLTMIFAENVGSAEKEVCKLFADLTGKSVKDIEQLKAGEFLKLIGELFEQDGMGDFLSTALK